MITAAEYIFYILKGKIYLVYKTDEPVYCLDSQCGEALESLDLCFC